MATTLRGCEASVFFSLMALVFFRMSKNVIYINKLSLQKQKEKVLQEMESLLIQKEFLVGLYPMENPSFSLF